MTKDPKLLTIEFSGKTSAKAITLSINKVLLVLKLQLIISHMHFYLVKPTNSKFRQEIQLAMVKSLIQQTFQFVQKLILMRDQLMKMLKSDGTS